MKESNVLECCFVSGRFLLDVLSFIYSTTSKHAQFVVLSVAPASNALRVTLQERGALEATLLLREEAFSSFMCRDAELSVRVPLGIFRECLTVLVTAERSASFSLGRSSGANPHLQAQYVTPVLLNVASALDSMELVVVDECGESEIRTQCRIRTFTGSSDQVDLEFHTADVVLSGIVKSELLAHALSEIDFGGANYADILVSESTLCVQSGSYQGGASRTVEIICAEAPEPNERDAQMRGERSDLVLQWQCTEQRRESFRLLSLTRVLRALNSSQETRMRMNEKGLLAFTIKLCADSFPYFPVVNRDPSSCILCFVEFVLLPLEE
ncbi:Cell cycle checkpoint protein RAD1 [Porphyridium purpureum]|uniref:Cell cycle checkpoint protein RAD1 n=1 Tax=Porphyridium purpureum TaxID=35688 RepID=A0A5J4YPI6_PORPP|nr:Cell cycle checkpoint protein RAD1 [Porphyridium purpureum]|eukprot:POR2626..scf295_9